MCSTIPENQYSSLMNRFANYAEVPAALQFVYKNMSKVTQLPSASAFI